MTLYGNSNDDGVWVVNLESPEVLKVRTASIIRSWPVDGGSTHLWNVCLLQRDHTAIYLRRLSLISISLIDTVPSLFYYPSAAGFGIFNYSYKIPVRISFHPPPSPIFPRYTAAYSNLYSYISHIHFPKPWPLYSVFLRNTYQRILKPDFLWH
jgi:hypothetical protein